MTDELEPLGIDFDALDMPASAAAAAALGLYWVAGPSLKAVGKAFGDWTELRIRNLLRLGEKVSARLPGDGAPDGQSVPPKLLYRVLEDGSWVEDDVTQEYLAGILVGSRSPGGENEDGVYLAHIVSNLTSNQIRLHHAIYAALAKGASPTLDIGLAKDAADNAVWVPLDSLAPVVKGSDLDAATVFSGLALEHAGLVDMAACGDPAIFTRDNGYEVAPPRAALVAVGTVLGRDLFDIARSGMEDRALSGPIPSSSWVSPVLKVPREFM